MRRSVLVALTAASLMAVPAVSSAATASDTKIGNARVCATAKTGFAACHAHVRTKGAKPDATTTYQSGFRPADLVSAYNLGGATGTATIAVVDAYNNPNAAADLKVYRDQFGLGTANLRIVNQNGATTPLATPDVGWGQEEMLDLEMVSAICPACPIIYIGGNSASFADLGTAVDTAVRMGATVVSNSYGAPEFSGEATYAGHYNHPNVAITVSSGDNGYGVEVPAAYNTVTAVGGTNLQRDATKSRGWTESAWSGAGSGCSALIAKPSTQSTVSPSCSRRTVADVSAVADPNTGVAVYDSYGSTAGNWMVFGGTSVAAPIIAGVYGLAGALPSYPATTAYNNKAALNDVTSGSNGRCVRGKTSTGAYLCTGVTGYDGPTGLGTPNGIGAF